MKVTEPTTDVIPAAPTVDTHLHHVIYQGQHYTAQRGRHGGPLHEVALLSETTPEGAFQAWLEETMNVPSTQVAEAPAALKLTAGVLNVPCQACGAAIAERCHDLEGQAREETHAYRQGDFRVEFDPSVHVVDTHGRRFSAKLQGLNGLRLTQDLDALEVTPDPVMLDHVVDAAGYTFEGYGSVLMLQPIDPEW